MAKPKRPAIDERLMMLAPPAVTTTRIPFAEYSMASSRLPSDNSRYKNENGSANRSLAGEIARRAARHGDPLPRAGGAARHLAHRGRNPLAAPHPGAAV